MEGKNFMNLFDLKGKVAVVAGGAGGIGRDIVLALGQYGCEVAVLDIDTSKVKYLEEAFNNLGKKIVLVDFDITKEDCVKEAFEEVMNTFGTIDILVNCAGINKRVPITEVTEEDWNHIVNINLKGTFLCCREAAKFMKKQNKGKIINYGSVSSVIGHPNHGPYAASKGGVLLLTKVMAMELAKHNVNVNAIGPAYIETDLTRDYLNEGSHYQDIVKTIPMGRLGKTEDMVGATVFLASKASDFITGALLLVDGGRTAD